MQMPDTVEDLESAITDALAEANTVLCNNPSMLEEYERRCKQVYTLHHAWNQISLHVFEIAKIFWLILLLH